MFSKEGVDWGARDLFQRLKTSNGWNGLQITRAQAGAVPRGRVRMAFVNPAGRPFGCHPKGSGEPSAFFFRLVTPAGLL